LVGARRHELERVRAPGGEQVVDLGHCYYGFLRAAARMVLRSSIARVIGPTPPRRGLNQPATSCTASTTSDATFRPSMVPPAPTTAPPGFTMSGVTRPGDPAAALRM